jgi:hypothetical protein
MLKITLTFPTPDGSRELPINGDKTTFGRGSEAEHRFPDDGLSRLHATVYRDGDRVWVVDENSSNGTFVNGEKVNPAGTPLKDGDSIKIGHQTVLRVHIASAKVAAAVATNSVSTQPQTVEARSSVTGPISILPIALIAFALLLVSVSVVFIGFKIFGSNRQEIVQNPGGTGDIDDEPETRKTPPPTPRAGSTVEPDPPPGNTSPGPTVPGQGKPPLELPAGKTYLDLSDGDRRNYLRDRSMRVAQIIGNNSSEAIPDAAIDKIKAFADAFAKRGSVKPLGGCKFGDNLQATYERASKNAPFIVRAFNEKAIDPRIGLYLAMIESEHCVCLQSPTKPLGMFQFTYATAKTHFGPDAVLNPKATTTAPDDRCKPEPAARAAASYMKALTGRYGTGPASVPLAIGSYNSGEGGLSKNLVKALESNSGLPRDFWTLISKGDILSEQFQSENFKYVPKFFAAAIVGEYPKDFGLKLQALSTYSQ